MAWRYFVNSVFPIAYLLSEGEGREERGRGEDEKRRRADRRRVYMTLTFAITAGVLTFSLLNDRTTRRGLPKQVTGKVRAMTSGDPPPDADRRGLPLLCLYYYYPSIDT
jgi:hypothetical protein